MVTRNPERTRGLLLEAGVKVLEEHYVDGGRDVNVVPISVSDAVARARDLAEERGLPAPTQSAVTSAFGSKADYLRAIALEYANADALSDAVMGEFEDDPDEPVASRAAALATRDVEAILGDPSRTRHYLQMHAHSSSREVAEQLQAIYEMFDAKMLAVYAAWLIEANKRVSPKSVAIIMTAVAEGLAMRSLAGAISKEDRDAAISDLTTALYGQGDR